MTTNMSEERKIVIVNPSITPIQLFPSTKAFPCFLFVTEKHVENVRGSVVSYDMQHIPPYPRYILYNCIIVLFI